MLLAVDLGAHLCDSFYCTFGSFLHTFSQDNGISACCQVLHTFINHCLSQYGCSGGTVACYIVRLGSNFLNQLCAHIFKRIFQFDFLCNGYTVVGDKGCAVGFIKYNVSSFRAKGYSDGIC